MFDVDFWKKLASQLSGRPAVPLQTVVSVLGDEHAGYLVPELQRAAGASLKVVPALVRNGWSTQTFFDDWEATLPELQAAVNLQKTQLLLVVLGAHDAADAPYTALRAAFGTGLPIAWVGPPRISKTFEDRTLAVRQAQMRAFAKGAAALPTTWLDGFSIGAGRTLTTWGYSKWAERILQGLGVASPVLDGALASVG